MANKSYIHVVGIVGVVVFSLVLALSVGAIFFAGSDTALAYEGTSLESINIPVSMLKYYQNGTITTVGGSRLQITLSNSAPNNYYYFINFVDIYSVFGDTLGPASTAFYFSLNGTVNKGGSGTIYFYGSISPSVDGWARAILQDGPFTNRTLYGLNLRFGLTTPTIIDESIDSWVDITSITMYYYDNDRVYDLGFDTGYEDGYTEGYDTGYDNGVDDGYTDGYENGFDSGVLEGLSDGYEQGFQEGRLEGEQVGFDNGYAEGLARADEVISWSNSIPLSVSSVLPYVDEVDNMHGYSVENATVPDSNVPAIRVSRTAPPMLPACQISLGSTIPAETIIEFRYENLLPRGLYSSGIYINFGALDQYGMYHYLTGSSTDSNGSGFTVSLPVDTQYIVVSTSQSVDYMYLVGVSYRIAGRTAYDIGLNVGYETGYLDGKASIPVDDIKNTSYYEGFDDGVQSANEYTFTGLIGAAIDAPIKAFRGLFGFDVLGTNLANLALSLFTLSIILVVVKFVIKSS